MTDGQGPGDLHLLGLEPDDLDGHTLDELTDYLEAGRQPRDPSIEGSAGCQLALDALQRLRGLGGQLIDADAAAMPEVEESWVDRILDGIALDARAGRRIPFAADADGADFAITEGAVRGLVRSAENAVDGLLVGSTHLRGDASVVGSPIRLEVEASAFYGARIPDAVARLRTEIAERLRHHTELNVVSIDITVSDIQQIDTWAKGTR
ncbi:Asp23/Gls24 family envelope stress response protein [Microbacterium sp. C5A9]|uniref:Asp23/Gls24 family envelope stress response protein n=1 Tax=Microbacterium sp. C5A9 TaxID=2736663 RepID=UPI001F525328|nr:Asp23/Gls24 family envelope stress response protein [Microbacterium sp. C5A9]MCI1017422.1 Asp23/Gls24 family envelope stress response protein [Microbacterium sp. C5A9]